MKDLKGKLAFGILCGIFGLIISMQFRTVRNTTGGELLSPQRAQQLNIELRSLREEKEKFAIELTELENRLKEYELSEADESTVVRNLQSDLERFQVLSGYRTIEGPGVIVVLEDVPSEFSDTNNILYNFEYLLQIINKLNSSGAEAIAINDQRYLSTTEIFISGNSLQVNSVPITPPIEIKAIGNPESMEAALNMRFGIIYSINEENLVQSTVKKQNLVTIPRHTKVSSFEYAKPIEITQ